MQVPKRKSEKYTHLPVDPNMTQEKYSDLSDKLQRMLKKRPSLAKDVQIFAANGDFSENAEYQIAKGKLRGLNKGIDETKSAINNAVIIKPQDSGVIALGSTVTVGVNGKEITYHILGSSETKPEKGIISHNSPIGSALIGKRVGEKVVIMIRDQEVLYDIININ